MMTARRLSPFSSSSLLRLAACLVASGLTVLPAAAQGELEFRHPGQLMQPILGSITDDGGPFSPLVWDASTVVTQWSLPPEEDKTGDVPDSPAAIRFNPVSGRAVTAWIAGPSADVLFSRFAVGGWSTPVVLATGAAELVLHVAPADGTIHIVYTTPDNGAAWHRQVPAGQTTWTAPERVSAEGERASQPTITTHGSRPVVAYEVQLGGPDSPRNIVIAQAMDTAAEDGPRFLETVLAITFHREPSRIRLDSEGPGGRLVVRWIAAPGQFGWVVRNPYGVWGPVGVEPFEAPATDPAPGRSGKHR